MSGLEFIMLALATAAFGFAVVVPRSISSFSVRGPWVWLALFALLYLVVQWTRFAEYMGMVSAGDTITLLVLVAFLLYVGGSIAEVGKYVLRGIDATHVKRVGFLLVSSVVMLFVSGVPLVALLLGFGGAEERSRDVPVWLGIFFEFLETGTDWALAIKIVMFPTLLSVLILGVVGMWRALSEISRPR